LCYEIKYLMSHPLNNIQEYFKEIEAEMEALRAAVRAQEEAPGPVAPSALTSAIGDIPVMQFQGPVEPFTLTVKQLEILHVCWNEVQRFLRENGATNYSSLDQPKPVEKAPRAPRSRETKGWAAERAAELGVSLMLNPDAGPNTSYEPSSNGSETAFDEATGAGLESPAVADQGIHGEELPMRERPNYGVSRIDQPEKANHGWYVRITKNGHTEQKFFADKSYGGKDPALEQAREFRDLLKEQIFGIPRPTPSASAWKPAEHTSIITNSEPHSLERQVQFQSTLDEDDDMKI